MLTKLHDVYIWGKGFQGQLGMGKEIQTISIPKYLSAFNKPHPVNLYKYILLYIALFYIFKYL